MRTIKKFNFQSDQIRTLIINKQAWFFADDITKALGYKNGTRALHAHTKKYDRISLSQRATTESVVTIFWKNPFDHNKKIFLNEAGVYKMIFASHLPAAQQFEDWVTYNVLPSIRKIGSYTKPAQQSKKYPIPKTYADALQLAANQQKELEKDRPKANYYDHALNNRALMPVTVIAKQFGIGAHRLNVVLNSLGVIYKQGRHWVLYSRYQNFGLAGYNQYNYDNNTKVSSQLEWTQRGYKFIRKLLIKQGFTPVDYQTNLF